MIFLIVQIVLTLAISGWAFYAHSAWLPLVAGRLSQSPEWYLSSLTQIKNIPPSTYISFGLVLILNLLLLLAIFDQMVRRHWDISGVTRGFLISLSGLVVVINLTVYDTCYVGEAQLTAFQTSQLKGLKVNSSEQALRKALEDLKATNTLPLNSPITLPLNQYQIHFTLGPKGLKNLFLQSAAGNDADCHIWWKLSQPEAKYPQPCS